MKKLIIIYIMLTSILLNIQGKEASRNAIQIRFDYKFEENSIFMPPLGFLFSPFNAEENVYLYEIQKTKLIIYNFPTYEYIKKHNLNSKKLHHWKSLWDIEKEEIFNQLHGSIKIHVSPAKLKKIEIIEIRLVYHVKDCDDYYTSPDKIKYKSITVPFDKSNFDY